MQPRFDMKNTLELFLSCAHSWTVLLDVDETLKIVCVSLSL